MGSSRQILAMGMLVALSMAADVASAQTWNEIFKQKKTQKKYLLQQIAALQVYIGYAKKGYDLVGSGIHLVKDITGGEFGLHKAFFASLAVVNPGIKNSAVVGEIVSDGLGIISVMNHWKDLELSETEWAYVALVKSNLLAECARDLEELILVTTSGKLETKDDERLRRLEKLRLSVQDKYDFALSFTSELEILVRQRLREKRDISEVRRWYEVE